MSKNFEDMTVDEKLQEILQALNYQNGRLNAIEKAVAELTQTQMTVNRMLTLLERGR